MLTLHIFTFTEDHTVLFTEAKGDHKNFFNAVPPRGGYPHSKEQRRQKRWKLSMYYTQKDLGSIFSLNKKKVRRLVSGSTCKSPLHLDNYKADQSANQLFLDPPTRRTQGTPLPSRCRDKIQGSSIHHSRLRSENYSKNQVTSREIWTVIEKLLEEYRQVWE